MHSAVYQPEYESGAFYNDEKIKLGLPLPITEISERDKNYPPISDFFDGIDYK
jgi:dTDP-4-dehydrorhamnose 3,5-epimerase